MKRHSIKNVQTDSHQLFYDFIQGKSVMLLTGSPVASPDDAYAYIRFTHPRAYRSKQHFMNLHVQSRDAFKNVTAWKNEDKIKDNLMVNSARILKEDVLKDLPEVTYTPVPYELAPPHYALYKELAESEMIQLEDGGKIDASSTSALYNKLSQIICNYEYFARQPGKPQVFEVIDELLTQMNGKKLMIFAKYRMINENITTYLKKSGYHTVSVYGGNSSSINTQNAERFKSDPSCQILVGQPSSIGYGFDGFQKVCRDASLPHACGGVCDYMVISSYPKKSNIVIHKLTSVY